MNTEEYLHRKPPEAQPTTGPPSRPSPLRSALTGLAGRMRSLTTSTPLATDPGPAPPPAPSPPENPIPAPTPPSAEPAPPEPPAAEAGASRAPGPGTSAPRVPTAAAPAPAPPAPQPAKPDPAAAAQPAPAPRRAGAFARWSAARKAKPATPPPPPGPPFKAWHGWVLAGIVTLGLLLRLREPWSSPILGAEDPYLHMERTWNLVQGHAISDYPPGLMILLFPFTLLGPDAFYTVARWLPPFLGAGAVLMTFFLCRPYVRPTGALAASLFVATMREHIFRTNLLMPTTLDMILVPLFLLMMLRVSESRPWSLKASAILAAVLFLVHPWAIALLVIPVGIFWLVLFGVRQERRKWTVPAAAGGFLVFFLVLNGLPIWSPTDLVFGHAVPRVGQLAMDPASFLPLPIYVDLPLMVGLVPLALAAVGGVLAVVKRSRFGLLALLWTGLLLPLVLVDWFDLWFIPHRTVVYFALGVVMLCALAVSEIVAFLESARPQRKGLFAGGAIGLCVLLTLPGALGTQTWYRIYDENDFAAWDTLEARGRPYVVTANWEMRAGYRAVTGGQATFQAAFFEHEGIRDWELSQHPGLVVLVDNRSAVNETSLRFLDGWEQVGEWGDVRAYRPRDA